MVRFNFPLAVGLALGVALLQGCLKPDDAALQSVSVMPRTIPDCAGCHAYPLHDVNHNYHMRGFNPRESMQALFVYERRNGVLICMDCHFGSIAHRKNTWYDTIWGTEGDLRSSKEKLPNDPIYRIDSIPGFISIPAGADAKLVTAERVDFLMDSTAKIGAMVQWLTGPNHMNGTVDVEFSPNIVLDSALSRNAHNTKDLSCSSIECHNAPKKKYRWGSSSLHIHGCPTVEHTPAEDSSCGYSPKQEP